jgi:hypothetical protein
MEPVHIDPKIQEEAEKAGRNAVKKAKSLRRKRKAPPPGSSSAEMDVRSGAALQTH